MHMIFDEAANGITDEDIMCSCNRYIRHVIQVGMSNEQLETTNFVNLYTEL